MDRAKTSFECAFNLVRPIDRQQAAVDHGAGALREGVLGVSAGEHSGHTGGAHLGIVKGDGGEARDGAGIIWILHHGLEVGAELSAVVLAPRSKAARVTSKRWIGKFEFAETCEAVGEVIDGVVPGGQRAVTALVGDLRV